MKDFRKSIWISFLLCSKIALLGAPPEIRKVEVRSYNDQNGLSSKFVYAIVKDNRGVLWIGTESGLNRFDGRDFRTYSSVDGLQSNRIHRLFWGSNRYLWLLYQEPSSDWDRIRAIDVFDIYSGTAVSFDKFFGDTAPFLWTDVRNAKMVGGSITFELKNGTRYVASPKNGFFKIYAKQSNEKLLHFSAETKTLWATEQLASNLLIFQKDLSGKKLQQHQLNGRQQRSLDWVFGATSQAPIFSYNDEERFEWEVFELKAGKGIVQRFCKKLRQDELPLFSYAQVLWPYNSILHVAKGGTEIVDFDSGATKFRISDVEDFMFQNLYADGVIWQATQGGMKRILLGSKQFEQLFIGNGRNHAFRGIVRSGDNLYLNSEKGTISLSNSDKVTYMDDYFCLGKAVDEQGRLWAGCYKKLQLHIPQTGEYKEWIEQEAEEYWSIYPDLDGKIWFSRRGLFYLDLKRDSIMEIDYGNFEELKYHVVYHFYRLDPKTILLCATSGIYEMDLNKGIMARYWPGGKGRFRFPVGDFRHLYHDKKRNEFWFATGGYGLLHWVPARNYTKLHDFGNHRTNILHSVYSDKNGYLWSSTDKGIVQFDSRAHNYRVFYQSDGIHQQEFNRISHFQSEDGTLYFGSIDGVTRFNPDFFQNEFSLKIQAAPKVVEAGQFFSRKGQFEVVTPEFYQSQKIVVKPGDRFLRFKLAVNDLKWNDGDVRFSYQLKNLDHSWIEADGNDITLAMLPYGTQVLRVAARLSNGYFSEEVLEIPILVLRPFYLQAWFWIVIIGILIVIIYGVLNFRIRQIRKLQQMRIQIALDLHDHVGAILSRLAMQVEMMKHISFDRIPAVADDVARSSRGSIDAMRDIIWSVDARNDSCENLVQRMEEQMEELLTPAGIGFSLDTKGVVFKGPLTGTIRQHAFFIFKEAIVNTMKHSQADNVFVKVVYEKWLFQIEIREDFKKTDNQPRHSSGGISSGSGLRNMTYRAKQIGADLKINQDDGYHLILTKVF